MAGPSETTSPSTPPTAGSWPGPSWAFPAIPHRTSAGASTGVWALPPSTSVPWPKVCSTATPSSVARELGSWDYLGGMLICMEAGAVVAESEGRDLVTLVHSDRRTPVAAATRSLLDQLIEGAAGS